MKKSKLYLLLRSLSSKEKRNFELFVSSKLYSQEKNQLTALTYLNNQVQKEADIDKKQLFSFLYPSKKYSDTKLRLAQSQLFKLAEKFLQLHYCTIDENLSLHADVFLLKYYRKNKLEKLYSSQVSKMNKSFAKDNSPKWRDQLLRAKLDTEIETYQYNSAVKRRQALNLQEVLDTIDLMYYANKLKFACMAYAHQTVFNQEYNLENMSWVLEEIQSKKLSAIPLVGAYYHAYHMIREPDNEILFQYFDGFLKENEAALAIEDLQTLYLFALNHCIRKLNNGQKKYGHIGLAFYERALQNGVLLIDGHLSRFTYRNIAMMAIRADDLDWAESFTHKYADLLRKSDKSSAFQFNLALVNYYKGAYPEALMHIQEADFKDHLIHLAAKTLQAKIYFEMNADQSLYSLLDSVDIYLVRNKIIGYHRHNYRNIIKYFKKLSRLNPYDKEKKEKLRTNITKEEILTEKKWLLEKLG